MFFIRHFFALLALTASLGSAFAQDLSSSATTTTSPELPVAKHQAYVVPIEGQINDIQLFILRRALKQAIRENVDTVVLKIDTPGGALDTTLEIMDAMAEFEGQILAYVDNEAISAGAYISAAADQIYFAPGGLIGAAAVIQGTGQEVPETMNLKITSYLMAKVRSLTSEHRYRSDVIKAMMDKNYVLEIDGQVLKPEGELLTLTADEALETYGNPPVPLLAAGIAASVHDVLYQHYSADTYELVDFQITEAESLAKWLKDLQPIFIGLALLLLFIEFKTPGFGIFGIGGIALFVLVFLSNYIAGLSGYESIAIFFLGVALVFIDIFFLPGTFILGFCGILLVLGSILWNMADIWPTVDGFELDLNIFMEPLLELFLAIIIAAVGVLLLARYIKGGSIWDRLFLKTTLEKGSAKGKTLSSSSAQRADLKALIGKDCKAVTDMFPSGSVELDGKLYEARVRSGSVRSGDILTVIGVRDFALHVIKKDS